MRNPNKTFWSGKRVLLTGHTGFKGSWLALWLQRLGADVIGVALPASTNPNLNDVLGVAQLCESNICDIRSESEFGSIVADAAPEIVFHLAAQPLVRASYADPLETFGTNLMGTANLLNALRGVDAAKVAVMVTTDKVYRNLEWQYPYRETDVLGGHDPYSASKAASEIIIESYRNAFLADRGVAVASARAGNVIGGGDWSQDRLIPDAVRAWQSGVTLEVRNPSATRPWQHVLEPLAGYLLLAEKLFESPSLAGAFNFGPETQDSASVQSVIEIARNAFGSGAVKYGTAQEGVHEAGRLQLEIAKSREALDVVPRWNLQASIEKTMSWYRAQGDGAAALELCTADIDAFEAKA